MHVTDVFRILQFLNVKGIKKLNPSSYEIVTGILDHRNYYIKFYMSYMVNPACSDEPYCCLEYGRPSLVGETRWASNLIAEKTRIMLDKYNMRIRDSNLLSGRRTIRFASENISLNEIEMFLKGIVEICDMLKEFRETVESSKLGQELLKRYPTRESR